MKRLVLLAVAAGWAGASAAAYADDTAPPAAPGAPAPAAPAAPTSNAMTSPALSGPLVANPNPAKFDSNSIFGPVYVTGVLSGVGLWESNHFSTDHESYADISNGQVIVQNTSGPMQFFAQAGIYSIPDLGSPYIRASQLNSLLYGPLPVAWGKYVFNDTFNVQAGKLPTLIGAEYTFSFQNMNIERGLLWNQEPAVSKGVQANLTTGPVAWSVSFTDGFDSDRYNWLTGAAIWTIDPANTLEVAAGGNFGQTNVATLLTPTAQSNSTIINLMYTYNAAPWTITPYFQYTEVPKNTSLGFFHDASTVGFAVLANYSINDNWNLAGRAEYISSSGSVANGAANLLYGPGSDAWSLTLTPTWQQGIFFARAEGSIVEASSTTPGFAFGKSGNQKTQGRLMLEGGILF
ncbi:MAG TPA: outer membrane beta-barrel protein [Stellaceae bacterium]|jgi:hypothetical protein